MYTVHGVLLEFILMISLLQVHMCPQITQLIVKIESQKIKTLPYHWHME